MVSGFFHSMTHTTLYYREGSSDKVYQAAIEPLNGGFVVNYAYGRRGTTLTTGSKTLKPVDEDTAQCIYDQLVKAKLAKGYTAAEAGVPYQHSAKATQVSGFVPQLLGPIEEDELDDLLDDPAYWAQEKFDGRRMLIQKQGKEVHGINRKGLIVTLPATLIEAAQALPGDFVLDGEAVGDLLHAFDLLLQGETDLRPLPYHQRCLALFNLLFTGQQRQIKYVESAVKNKRQLLQTLRDQSKEGVVFKHKDAPYTPGLPANGGSQFKYKFYATGSFIVAGINTQRSVALRVADFPTSLGNVTIPPNHEMPELGTVVEVRYLYAYPDGGCLYQPVYLGVREDIYPSQCIRSQLKYKP